MSQSFYPKRNGDYVYDVTVTKDEKPSRPLVASMSECIQQGRLESVQVAVTDAYGATVSEAMRALDAAFDAWRREDAAKSA